MENKLLPIGSVVRLKGGTHKILINGYFAVAEEKKDKVFTYRGCPFPEGILSTNGVALFDSEQIEEICYKGFENSESLDCIKTLEEIRKEKNL